MLHSQRSTLYVTGLAISVLVLSEIESDKLLFKSEHPHEQIHNSRISMYSVAVGTTISGDYIRA